MTDIAQQRCFNHVDREAAARCPECGRFFCRECVTEHGDRVICAVCLRTLNRASSTRRERLEALAVALRCAAGFLLLWLTFYLLGQSLLRLPTTFHEGTLWESGAGEEGS